MSLLIYEIKKMYFYQKGLLAIGLFFVLNMGTLIFFDTPMNPEVKMNIQQYSYYLEQINGSLSDEIEQFFSKESNRISDAKVAFKNAYTDYYDGNISEHELVTVSNSLDAIIKNESGYNLIFDQYMYVRENPENRYFLSTNGWDGLLSNDSLDFMLLLLLLILVTPVFCTEYTSEMNSLHLTLKKGARMHVFCKIVLVVITVIGLCLFTFLMRYGFFHIKYGLENGDYPLQSLSYFGTATSKNTLFSTFVWVSALKTFGNLCFAMLIMLISVLAKKNALTLFSSLAFVLIPYYGFSMESSKFFLPGPLGFMVATGFFRGSEMEFNIFTDGMDVIFEEISIMNQVIVFVTTLFLSIFALIVITIKHTNVWSTKQRHWLKSTRLIPVLVLCIAIPILAACTSTNESEDNNSIYNYSTRHSFENTRYRFYVDETDLDRIRIVFDDKKNGETKNFIRNPLQSLTKVDNSIYGNRSLVYYIKYDYKKSDFRKELDKFSIIEVDTTDFDEKIIIERNLNRDSILGLNKPKESEARAFYSIEGFFLDEKNIYLVGQDKIRRVNRLTGKIEVIIRSPLLSSISFDGRYIYYLNNKFQITNYDTKTGYQTVLPGIVTTDFVLADSELLFLNRKDKYKIYTMNLDDFTIRKITDKSVHSFTHDDQYIYYINRTDSKKFRIDRTGLNDMLLVE